MIENLNIAPLIEELFNADNAHQEYTDNDISFSIDSKKQDDNTIVITIKRNIDKAEFEKWVNNLDDDLYEEIWESLSNKFGLKELNSMYEGANYKNVISCFKNEAKKITQNKISELQSLLKTLN